MGRGLLAYVAWGQGVIESVYATPWRSADVGRLCSICAGAAAGAGCAGRGVSEVPKKNVPRRYPQRPASRGLGGWRGARASGSSLRPAVQAQSPAREARAASTPLALRSKAVRCSAVRGAMAQCSVHARARPALRDASDACLCWRGPQSVARKATAVPSRRAAAVAVAVSGTRDGRRQSRCAGDSDSGAVTGPTETSAWRHALAVAWAGASALALGGGMCLSLRVLGHRGPGWQAQGACGCGCGGRGGAGSVASGARVDGASGRCAV
jgi:hypothetical protein